MYTADELRAWADLLDRPALPFKDGPNPAAAPELLAACQAVTEAVEAWCEDWNTTQPTDPSVVLPQLRDAIAKATEGEVFSLRGYTLVRGPIVKLPRREG